MTPYFAKKDEYIDLLKQMLDEKRFIHSVNVAGSAVALATLYNADTQKAYIAGLLHDIMKNQSEEYQLKIMNDNGIILSQSEENNPKLWHAMSGMAYARSILLIDDDEILGAIRYHTTGKAGMTLLEKIIYIADYISAERDYPDVEVMRLLSEHSLERAALFSLKYTLSKLSSMELTVHTDSVEFYNELVIMAKKGLLK